MLYMDQTEQYDILKIDPDIDLFVVDVKHINRQFGLRSLEAARIFCRRMGWETADAECAERRKSSEVTKRYYRNSQNFNIGWRTFIQEYVPGATGG